MRLSEAKQLCYILIKHRKSILLRGAPGIGKSAIIKSIANELGYQIKVVECPVLHPVDVGGYVIPDPENKVSIFTKSPLLMDDPKSILLLEEIGNASPEIQASLYNLLLCGEINGFKHAGIVIGTTNRECDMSGVIAQSKAMLDRFAKLDIEPDLDDWMENYGYQNVHPFIVSFLKINVSAAYNISGDENPTTFRGWTMLSDCLEDLLEDRDLLWYGSQAYISKSIAAEFVSFVQSAMNSDVVDKILENGECPISLDPGLRWSLVGSLVYRMISKPALEQLDKIHKWATKGSVSHKLDKINLWVLLSMLKAKKYPYFPDKIGLFTSIFKDEIDAFKKGES